MSTTSEIVSPDLRLPPHSIEAEQSVLGALLVNNDNYDRIADKLRTDMFYRSDHRLIFDRLADQISSGETADVITIFAALQSLGKAEECGGRTYLNNLAQSVPGPGNVVRYAEIIREKSMLRRLLDTAEDIASTALNSGNKPSDQVLDEAESKIFAISEDSSRSRAGYVTIKDVLKDLVPRIEELSKHGGNEITGVPSGYVDLDRMLAGLQPGDLIIVAGRPSMGKTSFAMNVAEHVAVDQTMPVVVFSMEMSAQQLATRMLGSLSRVDQSHLRTGQLSVDEWAQIPDAVARLKNATMYIDETPSLNPLELRARARRLSRQCGQLGLVVIDYLQLMSPARDGENRATELSDISRSLKSLARELRCPVIALSQLNRELEKRPDKRPVMSDLRESGAIEQDADVILFIYRDEVYNKDSKDQGIAEINISKQRNGPTGVVHLAFLRHLTRFENLGRPYAHHE